MNPDPGAKTYSDEIYEKKHERFDTNPSYFHLNQKSNKDYQRKKSDKFDASDNSKHIAKEKIIETQEENDIFAQVDNKTHIFEQKTPEIQTQQQKLDTVPDFTNTPENKAFDIKKEDEKSNSIVNHSNKIINIETAKIEVEKNNLLPVAKFDFESVYNKYYESVDRPPRKSECIDINDKLGPDHIFKYVDSVKYDAIKMKKQYVEIKSETKTEEPKRKKRIEGAEINYVRKYNENYSVIKSEASEEEESYYSYSSSEKHNSSDSKKQIYAKANEKTYPKPWLSGIKSKQLEVVHQNLPVIPKNTRNIGYSNGQKINGKNNVPIFQMKTIKGNLTQLDKQYKTTDSYNYEALDQHKKESRETVRREFEANKKVY